MQSLLRVKIVPAISRKKDQDINHLRKEHEEAFEKLSLKYFLRDYTYLHHNWVTGKRDYASATEFLTKYKCLFLHYEIFYYNLSKIDSSWSIQCLMMTAHLLRMKLYSPPLMSVIE
ncbi:14570_t:CDS:2, partial [Dentiscutata heterogama]